MEEDQVMPTCITRGEADQETMSSVNASSDLQSEVPWHKRCIWWLQTAAYALALLTGQAAGVLLGRLYFDNGGNSKWMATLAQTVGFPLFFPLLFISTSKTWHNAETISTIRPSLSVLSSINIFLGVFLAGNSLLYSFGLKNLTVSTYSLISASQLAFNALFAFFLNSQKLTPCIINSLVLLTISAAILVIQHDSGDSSEASKNNHAIGFICTFAASAGHALMLSLVQLIFQKIIKKETFRVILEMSISQSAVATVAIIIGLFASGDWKSLKTEMEEFRLGKVWYIVSLCCTAVSWEIFSIGSIGLIFKVSSLFSNVIDIVGLPIAPVLAVMIFHDKVTGAKVISLLLAIWGFVSYVYHHYLEDLGTKVEKKHSIDEVL